MLRALELAFERSAGMRYVGICIGIFLVALTSVGCSHSDDELLTAAIARYELSCLPQLAAADNAHPSGRRVCTDVVEANPTWLAMGAHLAQAAEKRAAGEPDTTEPASQPFEPWEKRCGPAYAGDFWRSFGRDGKEFVFIMWDDTQATVTNPFALTMLAAAGVTGIALSGRGGNDQVENHYRRHGSQLNTFWDTVGDVAGNPGTHFAVAGAWYLAALATEDSKHYEAAKSMLSALSLTGLTTVGLKLAARTESPNGDGYGWPSGHTSSSFCFAAVVYEHYGPWAGVPLYAFAAFIGYERIDARNHDFADVISGALIGMAFGHIVAQNHQPKVLGMDIVPFTDPRREGLGIALTKRW